VALILRKTTSFFTKYVQYCMPDPYVFAILLTLLVAVLNFFIIPEASVDGIIDAWYQGVWGSQNIFVFTLQMTLILVTGTTLAKAPLIAMMLQKLASYPRNQVEAAILCFLTGAIASLINWGLGLVVGTLLAIEIVKRMEEVDFAYLVAAAYIWFFKFNCACKCGFWKRSKHHL